MVTVTCPPAPGWAWLLFLPNQEFQYLFSFLTCHPTFESASDLHPPYFATWGPLTSTFSSAFYLISRALFWSDLGMVPPLQSPGIALETLCISFLLLPLSIIWGKSKQKDQWLSQGHTNSKREGWVLRKASFLGCEMCPNDLSPFPLQPCFPFTLHAGFLPVTGKFEKSD